MQHHIAPRHLSRANPAHPSVKEVAPEARGSLGYNAPSAMYQAPRQNSATPAAVASCIAPKHSYGNCSALHNLNHTAAPIGTATVSSSLRSMHSRNEVAVPSNL
eukprot:scaffold89655_cov46-Prasinocladus_malaysianus.AAC.2